MPYITSLDIERIIGRRVYKTLSGIDTDTLADKIDLYNPIKYRELDNNLNNGPFSKTEKGKYLDFVALELDKDLKVAGEHRHDDWEKGWEENLQEYKKTRNIESLIPKYHRNPTRYARYDGRIVIPESPLFDYRLNSYIVDGVLLNYIHQYKNIFEFGCGTGHHLLRLMNYKSYYVFDRDKKFIGLDWSSSSQDILNIVGGSHQLIGSANNLLYDNFDFFKPNYDVDCSDGLVYTVAALEQIGSRHEELIQYWLAQKPGLVINFEPIKEVLDPNNELDKLSLMYMDKRGYLDGYLTRLQQLETSGQLKIEEVRRFYCGSQFLEGHTCIIWSPV